VQLLISAALVTDEEEVRSSSDTKVVRGLTQPAHSGREAVKRVRPALTPKMVPVSVIPGERFVTAIAG
jgi:hypothetical protein